MPRLLLMMATLLLWCGDARAFHPGDDCLWFSFGERIRGKNNEATIPVGINFGRFPDGKRRLSSLDSLRIYCFISNGGSDAAWSRKTFDRDGLDPDGFIYVPTREHDHVMLYAVAERRSGAHRTVYSAKSGFNRFSRRKSVESPDLGRTAADPVGLEVIPRFHYWRQVGEMLTIRMGAPAAAEPPGSAWLLDQHAAPHLIALTTEGSASYLIPDDGILNTQSTKASKIALVAAETREGGDRYVSTWSLLLHRNRTMHYNRGAGLAVLSGTALLSLGVVAWRRRKSGP